MARHSRQEIRGFLRLRNRLPLRRAHVFHGVHEAQRDQDHMTQASPKARAKSDRKASKDKIREVFLGRLPTGGVAIEIGVWHGDFSEQILRLIQPEKLYLIDPWATVTEDSHAEAFVGRTEDAKMERIFAKVQARFASQIAAGQVEIIREWSQAALARFAPESIDFAYVDGDHSYEGVKADLAALYPKMRAGGVMAFDDYHRRGWWGDGVIRATNEFLGQYPSNLRIRAIAGAQLAIEKLAPLERDG